MLLARLPLKMSNYNSHPPLQKMADQSMLIILVTNFEY